MYFYNCPIMQIVWEKRGNQEATVRITKVMMLNTKASKHPQPPEKKLQQCSKCVGKGVCFPNPVRSCRPSIQQLSQEKSLSEGLLFL